MKQCLRELEEQHGTQRRDDQLRYWKTYGVCRLSSANDSAAVLVAEEDVPGGEEDTSGTDESPSKKLKMTERSDSTSFPHPSAAQGSPVSRNVAASSTSSFRARQKRLRMAAVSRFSSAMNGDFTEQIHQGVEAMWHRGEPPLGADGNDPRYFRHPNPLDGIFDLEIDWRCGKARAGFREGNNMGKPNVWGGMRAFFRTRHRAYIFGIEGSAPTRLR